MANPYDPQRPAPPETFAGRARIVHRTAEFLEATDQSRRGAAILLHGHRGSGKTSALRKIQAMTRRKFPHAVQVEIPLRNRSSEAALLKDIVEEARRSLSELAGTVSRLRRALRRVEGVNVSILGTGVGVSARGAANRPNPLTLWRECLTALRGTPILCICIDDAELLDLTGLGTLKTMAESDSPVPILLAVAGGPDLVKRLSDPDSSPVARVFSGAKFDLEEFTPDETREALLSPLKASGVRGGWSEGATRRIWELSHGYPYLVKCFGYAAYREGAVLESADVDRSIPQALDVASSWLEREIPRASDVDVRTFAKIAGTGKTSLRSAEILGLGVQAPYIGRLVRLGVLKRTARGHYELRKAPAIAYYHVLRRNLTL